MSRNYRSISRYGSPYVHIAGEDGKPVCGRTYKTLDSYFKDVDKDATCKRCIARHEGLDLGAPPKAEKESKPRISREQAAYMRALAAVDNYVRLSTAYNESDSSEPLNHLRTEIAGAAITALDAVLYTGLYVELRRRAEGTD